MTEISTVPDTIMDADNPVAMLAQTDSMATWSDAKKPRAKKTSKALAAKKTAKKGSR